MSQITRVPWGLQKFLGSQNQGDNPSELAQTVAPTLDMDKFLSVESDRWFFSTVSTFSSPTTVATTVPEGELWRIKRLTAQVIQTTPTAADYIHVQCKILQLPNSTTGASGHPVTGREKLINNTGVGSYFQAAFEFPEPLLCWPGTQIQWRWEDFVLTAGNFSAFGAANYERLRV